MPSRRPIRGTVGPARVRTGASGTAATRQMRGEILALERRLAYALKKIGDATPEALEYGLQPVYEESQRLVPVKSGDLKESAFLSSARTPKGASANVGYAPGGSPSYAIFTHEMIDYIHDDPTSAKFLQYAYQNMYDKIIPRVQEHLRTTINKMKLPP